MKTIIVKSQNGIQEAAKFIEQIEEYAERINKDVVICTRYMDATNYNTIAGELKDAVALDDFDIFIIASVSKEMTSFSSLQAMNKAHTLVCEISPEDYENVKNYLIML